MSAYEYLRESCGERKKKKCGAFSTHTRPSSLPEERINARTTLSLGRAESVLSPCERVNRAPN